MIEGELSVAAVETHTSTERLVEGDVIVELVSDAELTPAPIETEPAPVPLEAIAPVYTDFKPSSTLDMVTYAESMPLELDIPGQSLLIHGAPLETADAPATPATPLRHTAKHANRLELLAGRKAA